MTFEKPLAEYLSLSLEDTKEIGKEIAKNLSPGTIVAFFGELGSGKTSLIKNIVAALSNYSPNEICSPTFNYLNIYPGSIDVYHFDLYRIKNEDQFLAMGFDEYLYKSGVCLIEWADKITPLLPPEAHMIHILKGKEENERKIVVLKL